MVGTWGMYESKIGDDWVSYMGCRYRLKKLKVTSEICFDFDLETNNFKYFDNKFCGSFSGRLRFVRLLLPILSIQFAIILSLSANWECIWIPSKSQVCQWAFTCSKLTIETLEQGVKCLKLTIKTPDRRQ